MHITFLWPFLYENKIPDWEKGVWISSKWLELNLGAGCLESIALCSRFCSDTLHQPEPSHLPHSWVLMIRTDDEQSTWDSWCYTWKGLKTTWLVTGGDSVDEQRDAEKRTNTVKRIKWFWHESARHNRMKFSWHNHMKCIVRPQRQQTSSSPLVPVGYSEYV